MVVVPLYAPRSVGAPDCEVRQTAFPQRFRMNADFFIFVGTHGPDTASVVGPFDFRHVLHAQHITHAHHSKHHRRLVRRLTIVEPAATHITAATHASEATEKRIEPVGPVIEPVQ